MKRAAKQSREPNIAPTCTDPAVRIVTSPLFGVHKVAAIIYDERGQRVYYAERVKA